MAYINVSKKSKSNRMRRNDVKVGEIFIVDDNRKGKRTAYMATGVRETTRPVQHQSISLKSGDTAWGKGDTKTMVVGFGEIHATIHDDFKNLVDLG